MDTFGGSYAFGAFRENDAELERLKRQARVALPFDRRIWSLAGVRSGMRALDLACGPGIVSIALADAVAPGGVLGVDLSEPLLAEARKLLISEGRDDIDFRQGNVYQLPVEDGTVDFIYARLLMQHLDEPVRAIREMVRVLAPGGICCLVDVDDGWSAIVPEEETYARFLERVARGQAAKGGDRYVGRKLGRYLHEAGLGEVQTHIIPVTSDTPGLDLRTFLELTTRFKREHLPLEEQEEGERELEAIMEVAEKPFGWAAAGIFASLGRRSESNPS